MVTRRGFLVGGGMAVASVALGGPAMSRTLAQVDARLTTEILTRAEQVAALDARLKKLEGVPAPTPTSVIEPVPGQVIKQLPTGAPQSTFMSLFTDNAVDVIECAGKYQDYRITDAVSSTDNTRRTPRTRPIIVRKSPVAPAVFDGMGHAGLGFFHGGANVGAASYPSAPTTDITFDGLTFQNYPLADDGLFYLGWFARIRLLNLVVRNVTGIKSTTGQYALSHVVYVSVGGDPTKPHARSQDIVIADLDVLGDRTINGVQSYRLGNVDGLQILRGKWAGLNRFAFLDGDPINVLVDGCVVDSVNAVIDAANTPTDHAQGIVRNLQVTNAPIPKPGVSPWLAPQLVAP